MTSYAMQHSVRYSITSARRHLRNSERNTSPIKKLYCIIWCLDNLTAARRMLDSESA